MSMTIREILLALLYSSLVPFASSSLDSSDPTYVAQVEMEPVNGAWTAQWQCYTNSSAPLGQLQGLCDTANEGSSSTCNADPYPIYLAPDYTRGAIYEAIVIGPVTIACPQEAHLAVVTIASTAGLDPENSQATPKELTNFKFLEHNCEEEDLEGRHRLFFSRNGDDCVDPWWLDNQPFSCDGGEPSEEDLDPVIESPCLTEGRVITSQECPVDILESLAEPIGHAYAAVYVFVFVIACMIAVKKECVPFKPSQIAGEAILLWLSVSTAMGTLTACPNYLAYGIDRLLIAMPLLLVDSFEVFSFLIGAIFVGKDTQVDSFDKVRWAGLSRSHPCARVIAGIYAIFAGIVVYGLNYAVFLASESLPDDEGVSVTTSPDTWELAVRAICGALGVLITCAMCCALCYNKEEDPFPMLWNFAKTVGAIIPNFVVAAVRTSPALLGWTAEIVMVIFHFVCNNCSGDSE